MDGKRVTHQDIQEKEFDHLFKILLLGHTTVGKTCLMLRFGEDKFVEQYNRTVSFDFRVRTINLFGLKIKLEIWDSHSTMKSSHFRSAHGIIILHDPSQPLDDLKLWLDEIDRYSLGYTIPKLIVASKCDLKNSEKIDGTKQLAEGLGITFMNISARDSINCEECYVDLVCDVLKNLDNKW